MAVDINRDDIPRRYGDIIKHIIGGPYYDARGTILPYRTGNTPFRLKSDALNTNFGVFVNEVFTGAVVSSDEGDVEFDRYLPLGENVVTVINNISGYKFTSHLTVRNTALWQIAYAETMEVLDSDNLETKDNLAIETAHADGLLDRFGDTIKVYNNQGLDTDSYRWQLHELRNAYRNYGGKFRGVETAVAAFTQIPPFGYSRKLWGPNWVLDQQMLANSRFLDRSTEFSYDNDGVPGITIESFEADVPAGTPSMRIRYDATTNMLRWGTQTAWGPSVLATDGALFLPGPPALQNPYILGNVDTFVLAANKSMLYLATSGSMYVIDLSVATGYPVPALADLVSHINTEAGDTIVQAYNGSLLFTYDTDFIQVEPGLNNAAVAVFGVRKGDIQKPPTQDDLPGVDFNEIYGDLDIAVDAVIEYDATTVSLRWGSNGGMPPVGVGWVAITEDGNYTLTDNLGVTLEVHVFKDYLVYLVSDDGLQLTTELRGNASVPISVNYSRLARRVAQTKGCFVRVESQTLPDVNTQDLVNVIDDSLLDQVPGEFPPETPDRWWLDTWTPSNTVATFEPSVVVDDELNLNDPTSAFRYHISDPGGLSEITLMGRVLKYPVSDSITGTSYPQQYPALFYDYEGMTATFSGWFLSRTAEVVEVTLGFSFEAGAPGSWIEGPTVTINSDAGGLGLEDATYVEVETVIPADLTPNGVWVRAYCSQSASGISISMDGMDVDVAHITSRVLSNTTIPRTRHRQFYGELMFVWSPGMLTTIEQEYLGVIHKNPNVSNPFAGVLIQLVSSDTPPGKGLIEYEYNAPVSTGSTGSTYRLRWTAYDNNWTPGDGWKNVLSTGNVLLESTDGSFIEVYVTHLLLPKLPGTPPAAVLSKEVKISDVTTNQGIVRDIAPAHSSLDIIDVSEYGPDGRISNAKGPLTEADFVECELVNLLVNDGALETSPQFKTAFLSPEVVLTDVDAESLEVSPISPHVAAIEYESNQNITDTILLEDGIVMPNDTWQYNSNNEVEILDFNVGSVYTITYPLIYRVTTPYLDLGTLFKDYAWFADYMMWNRMEHVTTTRQAEVPVYFSASTGSAVLKYPSSMEQDSATLFYEDADGRVEISKIQWNFASPFEIVMDASSYISNTQYYLIHNEARMYPKNDMNIVFEHRSGPDTVSCEAAAWTETLRNRNVYVDQPSGGHVIHQLRLSISGVRDLRDFKIRSLVLKGLHVRGEGANVGGLTNV